jgi:hypothetical protein
MSDSSPVHIQGPLEFVDGRWLLRIPLGVGGQELAACTSSISIIRGDVLEIELPKKLVRNLRLKEGQHLRVNADGGQFTFEWEPTTNTARLRATSFISRGMLGICVVLISVAATCIVFWFLDFASHLVR